MLVYDKERRLSDFGENTQRWRKDKKARETIHRRHTTSPTRATLIHTPPAKKVYKLSQALSRVDERVSLLDVLLELGKAGLDEGLLGVGDLANRLDLADSLGLHHGRRQLSAGWQQRGWRKKRGTYAELNVGREELEVGLAELLLEGLAGSGVGVKGNERGGNESLLALVEGSENERGELGTG